MSTYASKSEIRQMRRLRERAGLSQTFVGDALCHTPLRTYQSWEWGKARMHRIIWQAAIRLLEAHCQAQQSRSEQGLPPLSP
jgi:DNA-binding transcriptional regulator YiaG